MAGKDEKPRTLSGAHEYTNRFYPGRSASAEHWRAYYVRAAEVYEEVAKIDKDHPREAAWYTEQQRKYAAKFAPAFGTDIAEASGAEVAGGGEAAG